MLIAVKGAIKGRQVFNPLFNLYHRFVGAERHRPFNAVLHGRQLSAIGKGDGFVADLGWLLLHPFNRECFAVKGKAMPNLRRGRRAKGGETE